MTVYSKTIIALTAITFASGSGSAQRSSLFLANCPGVKMDGGGDGVPCEKQWCSDR